MALNGFDGQVAETTIDTNYFGVLRVVEGVLPLLRGPTRTSSWSRAASASATCCRPELRARLDLDSLTRTELSALMRQFVTDVKDGRHREAGWPAPRHGTSKIGVTALAHLLARDLADDPRRLDTVAVCPGWVRTDMGGPNGERDVETGAGSILGGLDVPATPPTGSTATAPPRTGSRATACPSAHVPRVMSCFRAVRRRRRRSWTCPDGPVPEDRLMSIMRVIFP